MALHPIGAGESRRLPLGDLVSLIHLAWFPDGKHLLLTGATDGQPLRTYKTDLAGGRPEPLGSADFRGTVVASDGKRIAGQSVSGEAVVFDLETQKVQPVPGIEPEGRVGQWTEDGKALLVYSGTPWVTRVDRVEVATGKRTTLQKVELKEKSGSTVLYLQYAERTKTSVYVTLRFLGSLYVVEGLE